MLDQPHVAGSWKLRRRVIFGSLAFCAVGISAVLASPGDAVTAPIRGQIALALIGAALGIIGSYVFGAVWDDSNARKDKP